MLYAPAAVSLIGALALLVQSIKPAKSQKTNVTVQVDTVQQVDESTLNDVL